MRIFRIPHMAVPTVVNTLVVLALISEHTARAWRTLVPGCSAEKYRWQKSTPRPNSDRHIAQKFRKGEGEGATVQLPLTHSPPDTHVHGSHRGLLTVSSSTYSTHTTHHFAELSPQLSKL